MASILFCREMMAIIRGASMLMLKGCAADRRASSLFACGVRASDDVPTNLAWRPLCCCDIALPGCCATAGGRSLRRVAVARHLALSTAALLARHSWLQKRDGIIYKLIVDNIFLSIYGDYDVRVRFVNPDAHRKSINLSARLAGFSGAGGAARRAGAATSPSRALSKAAGACA